MNTVPIILDRKEKSGSQRRRHSSRINKYKKK